MCCVVTWMRSSCAVSATCSGRSVRLAGFSASNVRGSCARCRLFLYIVGFTHPGVTVSQLSCRLEYSVFTCVNPLPTDFCKQDN